jgi:hypothetical protein
MTRRAAWGLCLAGVLAAATNGCSISASSVSLSDSSGSLSKSSGTSTRSSGKSSDSSSPAEAEDPGYQADVSDYTASYVTSGGDLDAFEREIGALARKHGIADWAGSRSTYVAIGDGLASAHVDARTLEDYKATLGGADPYLEAAIQEGYDARRR